MSEIIIPLLVVINVVSISVLVTYAGRQYLFVYSALKHRKDPEPSVTSTATHTVSVLIPAHNEAKVIGRTLEFMSKLDYPLDKLEIIVLDDASKDSTSKIAHEYAARFPQIRVIDRPVGGMGKGDVLNQGIRESKNDIILIFDADYTPAPDTIHRLVRWFDDPKVGLVQGNIHVVNKDENMLTKMIHTERCAGFLVDLLARDNLKVSNQYGGTAGGFRRELIEAVGEWAPDTYCEDTDLTCRTLLAGYKVKYDVTVNCGEEAPDRLKVYYKQRYRWTRGHVLCGFKYTGQFLRSPFLSLREKVDGVLWLNLNCIPIFTVVASILSAICFLPPLNIALMSFEASIAYAVVMTGIGLGATIATVYVGLSKAKQTNYLKFSISMLANSYVMCYLVTTKAFIDIAIHKPFKWIKTERSGVVTTKQSH